MEHFSLTLYVTGRSLRSERALANLHQLCEEHLNNQPEIDVIDVLEQPEVAEQEKILATPMLVKVSPLPERRIIGDLSDTERVLAALDLHRLDHPVSGGKL